MDLGDKIKKIRYKYNINQEELAKMLDINRNYLSRIETNKSLPTAEVLIKLSLSFNISVDKLLGINLKEINGDKDDKIRKINKYCELLDCNDLDFVINLLNIMSNKK